MEPVVGARPARASSGRGALGGGTALVVFARIKTGLIIQLNVLGDRVFKGLLNHCRYLLPELPQPTPNPQHPSTRCSC